MRSVKHNSKKYALVGQKCSNPLCEEFSKIGSYERGCASPITTLLCPFSYMRAHIAISSRFESGGLCVLRKLLSDLFHFFEDDKYDGIAIGVDYYNSI